jgi:hypothetical protein
MADPNGFSDIRTRVAALEAAPPGSASWGGITGTLSAQTDLQTALDAKQAAGSYQPLATVLTNTTASFTTAKDTLLANQSGVNTGDQTNISGNAGTATALATGRTIAITGDITYTSPTFNGSANVTAAGTLATVNSNVGTFGSGSLVPVITVNAKGLVTAVTTAAVSGGGAGALGVHARQPNVAAGTFLTPQITALALGTIAAAANRLDYIPFIPARDITVDRMDVEVSTLIAASQARVAIYADNAGVPGAILRDGAAVLDCATTGLKSATITALAMTAGTTYWLAILSSSTQTYRGIAVGGLMPMLVNATLNTTYVHKRQTQTFASGMPATASGLSDISGTVPLIKLRVA